MSLGNCIPGLVEAGKLTKKQGEEAQRVFDRHYATLSREMAPATAAAEASERAIREIEATAFQRKRQVLLQAQAQASAEKWLRGGGERWGGGAKKGGDGPAPGEAEPGPVNPRAAKTLVARVDARRRALEGLAFSHMDELLAREHPGLLGKVRDPALMDEIGAAAYGEEAGESARELAKSFDDTAEMLRLRANAAGAAIGKRERWGLPQGHDSRAVAEAGWEKWSGDLLPMLDRQRMVDWDTGLPFTDAKLEETLRGVFRTISSDGALDRAPGAGGGRSLANSLGEHRFLEFKDYASWKAYNARYGVGTAYDAMMGHIRSMAHDVAAMELLGPSPEATVRALGVMLKGEEHLYEPGALRARDKAAGTAKVVQRMWDEYTGALRQPENRTMSRWFATYRNVAAAGKLGGATLTALTDAGWGTTTRLFNGLPAARIIPEYLKLLNPASKADRQLAGRLGFVADTWINHAGGAQRLLFEENTAQRSRRIAETVLRASGMNAWSDAGRMALGLSFLTHVTQERGKAFGELEPAFRGALNRYGIDAAGWEKVRSTPVERDGGADWIKPQNVADRELGLKLLEMIHEEQDFAVPPIANLETRSYMSAAFRRGTIIGELIRSSPLMFKTFVVSTMIRHGARLLDQPGFAGKTAYYISAFIPVMLASAVSIQLKQVKDGKDFLPMDDASLKGLWARAFELSGAAGIFSELAGKVAEDKYLGIGDWLAGPMVSDTTKLASAGVKAAKGDPRAPWLAARSIYGDVPGNNLWYTHAALNRMLQDHLQQAIDPTYYDSWSRLEDHARENRQAYWWHPGQNLPERAPDVGQGRLAPR